MTQKQFDRIYMAGCLLIFFVVSAFIVVGGLADVKDEEETAEETETPQMHVYYESENYGAVFYALGTEEAEPTIEPTVEPTPGRYDTLEISETEKDMIAQIIYLEARGESANGQQAVAEVILNRILADNFPDSVKEVLYQRDQFSTIGQVNSAEPTKMQYQAIEAALQGENILPIDVVYFSGRGENDREWGRIGNHVFCYQYEWR